MSSVNSEVFELVYRLKGEADLRRARDAVAANEAAAESLARAYLSGKVAEDDFTRSSAELGAQLRRSRAALDALEAPAKAAAAAQARAAQEARELARQQKEAELEAALGGAGKPAATTREIAVPDSLFAPGEASFAGGASARFARIVTDVKSAPAASPIRIEARAQDAGLAHRRAAMVRKALVAGGVADGRISVDAKQAKSASMRIRLEGTGG